MNEYERTEICVKASQIAREAAQDPKVTPGAIAAQIMDAGLSWEALAWGYAEQVAQIAHRDAVRRREHEATARAKRPVKVSVSTPTPLVECSPYPYNQKGRTKAEKCGCRKCVAALDKWWEEVEGPAQAAQAESWNRIQDMIQDSITTRAQEMFAEWTAELLSSTFALADGTRVTWAEATAQQHRDRIAMLTKQAAGTIETAALHERALRDMGQAGVTRLADLQEVK